MSTFPDSFLWGAALSAYPVEGGNFASDWWLWEQRPGRIPDEATSRVAIDHAQHFNEDYDLARKLGIRSLFLTFEWSRIQPEEDRFDATAIEHYRQRLKALNALSIKPICILQHVTLPAWLAERGGWAHGSSARAFAKYADRMAHEFARECRWWIPLYEPVFALTMGYIERLWPPCSHNLIRATKAQENVADAHSYAYKALHMRRPDVMVGVSVRGRLLHPLDDDSSWDLHTARREMMRCNHFYFNAITEARWPWFYRGKTDLLEQMDFIGLSYYGAETVRFAPFRPSRLFAELTDEEGRPATPLAPRTEPSGLATLIEEMAKYRAPILITGNGLATTDDTERCRHLLDHLDVLRACLEKGLDVRGYFPYAFLDGFEWTGGFSSRYGLVHVDQDTLVRTPNPSAYLYKDICEHGAFRQGTIDKFCPNWEGHAGEPDIHGES